MSLLRSVARGLRALFRKEQMDRELDEEFRATEEKMKHGAIRKRGSRRASGDGQRGDGEA